MDKYGESQSLEEFNSKLKDEHGNFVNAPPMPKIKVTSNLNNVAAEYYSTDDKLATAKDLWSESIENGETIWVADVDVIETFKTLNRLPKIGKSFALPHPMRAGVLITNTQFAADGECSESTDLYGERIKTWTLIDESGFVMKLQKQF